MAETMTTAEKETALQQLNEQWAAKDLPLKAGATNAVPGEGNVDSHVVFVGEGPGQAEDEQGRPFVGAAGKFLTELIESIGWQREDVYIANMVKHRPPGNRDPLPEELAAYAPWLDEQIAIIRPKLIVTLGRYSMAHFLGDPSTDSTGSPQASSGRAALSISRIHGQPKRRAGHVVMPMYHPAAALYRGNLRSVLKEDFAKITKVLELLAQDAEAALSPAEAAAKESDKQRSLL